MLREKIKIQEVEMGESLNKNTLLSIRYGKKQLIFEPRFKKAVFILDYPILNSKSSESISRFHSERFSLRAFISGGKALLDAYPKKQHLKAFV